MSLESGYTATLIVHRPGGEVRVVMETWEDGAADSQETKHRNPVTRRETARGGLSTRSNINMSRECDAATWAIVPLLEDSRGKDRVTCVKQMLGPRAEAIGAPEVVTGILKAVTRPNYNLSGDEVGMLEVEVSTDE